MRFRVLPKTDPLPNLFPLLLILAFYPCIYLFTCNRMHIVKRRNINVGKISKNLGRKRQIPANSSLVIWYGWKRRFRLPTPTPITSFHLLVLHLLVRLPKKEIIRVVLIPCPLLRMAKKENKPLERRIPPVVVRNEAACRVCKPLFAVIAMHRRANSRLSFIPPRMDRLCILSNQAVRWKVAFSQAI